MKFLCISCDQKMKLVETIPPREDSGVSVVYECPACSHRFEMVANRGETEVVSSLGLRIGGKRVDQLGLPDTGDSASRPSDKTVSQKGSADRRPSDGPQWTSEASARLENIPEHVRAMAKIGIEGYAKSRGYRRIDEKVLDEARKNFGM